jgi:hypothetical protein
MKVVDTPKKKLSHRKSNMIVAMTSDENRKSNSKLPEFRVSKLMKSRNASINDIYHNVSFNKLKMIKAYKKQHKIQ